MIETSWIENMNEAMRKFSKAVTQVGIEIGKLVAHDLVEVPSSSRWERIESRILEFMIKWW